MRYWQEAERDSFRGETPINSVTVCMPPYESWYVEGRGLIADSLFEGLVCSCILV